MSGVVVNLSFPSLRDISLAGSYSLYAVMAVASWFLVHYGVRETRNRELEDMTSHAGM
jgi:MFS transporter, SP family, sugar:H+ symporter